VQRGVDVMVEKKREYWADMAKGFLMILVVIGHSPYYEEYMTYIYWFHMPAFFILSGLFFKPIYQISDLWPTIKKRFFQLIVPYLSYLVLITIYRYSIQIMDGNFEISWYTNDILKLLVGGRFARGDYGVFWFITCLFVSQILFTLICLFFKNWQSQFILLLFCYTLAHIEGIYAMEIIGGRPSVASQEILVLWNIDVALLSVVYYSLGFYFGKYVKNMSWKFSLAGLIVFFFFVILYKTEFIHYDLNMKFLDYENFFLDLLIPISMTITLCGFFRFLEKVFVSRLLVLIQNHSLTIMYLHIFANNLLSNYFEYGTLMYTFVGVFIPLVFSTFIINKSKVLKMYLFGSFPRKLVKGDLKS
jgi:fucose 4-O-acetylase-like acetyltransferase